MLKNPPVWLNENNSEKWAKFLHMRGDFRLIATYYKCLIPVCAAKGGATSY